jgi:hypothetical protein
MEVVYSAINSPESETEILQTSFYLFYSLASKIYIAIYSWIAYSGDKNKIKNGETSRDRTKA